MFLGISLRVPLILVITLQDRKPLFCVFSRFRDLYGLKLIGDFSWIIIFRNMTNSALESRKRRHDEEKGTGGAPTPLGRATYAIFCLEPPQPSIKSSKRFS